MNFLRKSLLITICILGTSFLGYVAYTKKSNTQKTKKFHAIIFDMDGTTIDTDPFWKDASFAVFDSYAQGITPQDRDDLIASCQNLTVVETVLAIIAHLEQKHKIQLTIDQILQQAIDEHLPAIYENATIKMFPHFETFHEQVLLNDFKTAIATSSQGHLVNMLTIKVPLQNYFGDHIYHADHVNRAYKPKPDIYLHAAKMLGVDPCYCIAIEDSKSGIKAAKAAGMYCIGINRSGQDPQLLADADEIVTCFSEIDLNKLLN